MEELICEKGIRENSNIITKGGVALIKNRSAIYISLFDIVCNLINLIDDVSQKGGSMNKKYEDFRLTVKEGRLNDRYLQSYCKQIQDVYCENPQTMSAHAKIRDKELVEIRIMCSRLKETLTLGVTEGYYGEVEYGFGDIKKTWSRIRKDLELGEVPEAWLMELKEAGLITGEDSSMEEKIISETVEKEEEIMAEQKNKRKNPNTSEMLETRPEEPKVVKKQANLDVSSTAETMMKETIEEESYEENLKETEALPEIKDSDSTVVLTTCDDFQINMIACVDTATMQADAYRIYLSYLHMDFPFISSTDEVKITREKILAASDHKCMNILNRFDINLTEDNKKEAYERAKEFIETSSKRVALPTTDNVLVIYARLMKYCKEQAQKEKENTTLTADDRIYKFDKKEKTIAIRDSKFQKVMDDIDSNYTRTVFLKKLRLVEMHMKKTIIIANSSGGKGYGFNTTGNVRFYKFQIDEEILKIVEKLEGRE